MLELTIITNTSELIQHLAKTGVGVYYFSGKLLPSLDISKAASIYFPTQKFRFPDLATKEKVERSLEQVKGYFTIETNQHFYLYTSRGQAASYIGGISGKSLRVSNFHKEVSVTTKLSTPAQVRGYHFIIYPVGGTKDEVEKLGSFRTSFYLKESERGATENENIVTHLHAAIVQHCKEDGDGVWSNKGTAKPVFQYQVDKQIKYVSIESPTGH